MNSKYLRGRPFLVVAFTYQPKKGVNTSNKGWMNDTGNVAVFENVSIVDRVGKKELEANLIIDVIEGKTVKNTTGKADDEVMSHYIGRYADTIKQALQRWATEQITRDMATGSTSSFEDYSSENVGNRDSKVKVLPTGKNIDDLIAQDVAYFQQKLDKATSLPEG